MNLIVLSHMYPYEGMPYNGIFVKEQLEAVRRMLDGSIHVISPVPWAPRPLWFRGKWRKYGMAGRISSEGGISVIRPRYLNLPGTRNLHRNSHLMYLAVRKALAGVLRTTGVENTVLHSHALLPDGFAGAKAAREFGLGSLCTLHGSDINSYPLYSRSAYEFSRLGMAMNDSLVAVSGLIRERALKIFPSASIDVVTNGVCAGRFSPSTRKGRPGEKHILFVGKLMEEKGVRELVQAFHLIHTKRPDTRLTLIGEPAIGDWVSAFVRENGLEGALTMTGVVGRDELPEHYDRADLFVLPSYSEGMPVSMFEALAMRLPAVVSAVGGVPEVIRHGENGLLIKPRSVGDIVEKVSLLLDNPELAGRIAEAGFKEVREKYTWEASAGKLVEKYKELIGRGRTGNDRNDYAAA